MLRVSHCVSVFLAFAFVALLVPAVHAQAHFQDCVSMTGGNASIIVSTEIESTINGQPLESGDEIAVFTPDGLCAGTATWSGSNMSITAWGDDSITPEKDGFASGDGIGYKVWDASTDQESEEVSVDYSSDQPFYRTDGQYGENAIYVLSSLSATLPLPAPGVPALSSPANQAANVALSPTLTWEAASDAASYKLQVSTTENFSSLVANANGLTETSYSLSDLAEATVHYWRVRAVNESGNSAYSVTWSFTTTDLAPPPVPAPGVPALSSPADHAANVALSPTLTWEAASDAASYKLQVSTTENFSSPLANETGLTETSFSLSDLVEGTVHYWRVRSVNESGTSAYSATWRFTTTDPAPPPVAAPGVPALSSPANQAADVALTPMLSWEAASDAASYKLQVSTSSDFSSFIVNKTGITGTSYSLSELAEGTVHYWRVRAVNESGNSDYSSTWRFTTTNPEPPSAQAPSVPVLSSPANEASDVALSPTLTWAASSNAASYKLQVSTTEDFSSLVASQAELTETSVALGELAEGAVYFWRVRAVNASGISAYSAPWSFTTKDSDSPPSPPSALAPSMPALSSPSDKAADVSLSPTLSWEASSLATSYKLQVSTSENFTSVIVNEKDITKTSYSLSGLALGTVHYWRVRAVNEDGMSAYSAPRSFTTAAQENSAPNVTRSITNQNLVVGESATEIDLAAAPAVFTDSEGDALSYSASSDDTAVAVATIDGAVLSIEAMKEGSAAITVSATDEHGLSASLVFGVTVDGNPNNPPVFSSSPLKKTVAEQPYIYEVEAADEDGDNVTLTAAVIPQWISFTDNGDGTGKVTGTPSSAEIGVHEIVLQAIDEHGRSSEQSFNLSVSEENHAPRVVISETAVNHPVGDGAFTMDLLAAFEDADGDPLEFSASSSEPAVASVELQDNILIITPRQRGTATITLTATDTQQQAVSTSFAFSVEQNSAPVAVRDVAEGDEDTEIEIDALANDTDPDGDPLALDILTEPSHGTAAVRDDRIVYTPATNFNGLDSLVYRISDSFGGTATGLAVITIVPVDDAPSFPAADAITSPEDGANLLIGGATREEAVSPETGISIEWAAAVDPEGNPFKYVWELSASDDFSEPLLRLEVGTETSIEMTYGAIIAALTDYGFEAGSSVTAFHRVVAVAEGQSVPSSSREITLTRGTITSTDEPGVPQKFSLDQNYPNPFNPQTTISYTLEGTAFVTLKVYDILGKEVATLVSQEMAPGQHSVRFDADMLNSGTYFYRLNAGSFTAIKQMVLLR